MPVTALEWRIREDVPTNLRAVKKAALLVGERGVQATQPARSLAAVGAQVSRLAMTVQGSMQWDRDETMAAYLKD